MGGFEGRESQKKIVAFLKVIKNDKNDVSYI